MFPWIVSGLASILPVEQTFALWDRMIAYGSAEIIAVAAAAIFHYRRKGVEAIEKKDDLAVLFQNNANLLIIPILRSFLNDHQII
jgi:hypothetical protein